MTWLLRCTQGARVVVPGAEGTLEAVRDVRYGRMRFRILVYLPVCDFSGLCLYRTTTCFANAKYEISNTRVAPIAHKQTCRVDLR